MNKNIFAFVLVLIAAFGSIFFRFTQKSLPSFDITARQEVYGEEMSAMTKAIEAKYPGMYGPSKIKVAEQLFKDSLAVDKKGIEYKIGQKAQELKNRYQNDQGRVFMCGIDSYYWLRLVRNCVEKGHIGDRVVNGVEYDDLINAPVDAESRKNIHVWLGFIFYKTASFFNKGVDLEQVVFYVSIFLSLLTAIFVFLLALQLGATPLGGFFASLAVNCAPFLVVRLMGEWFDTDIYNVLFPLLVFGTFVYAFNARTMVRRCLLSVLSAAFLAGYASTWKGWWFIFDIMILSGGLFVLNQYLSQTDQKTAENKGHVLSLLCFFISTAVFISVLNGFAGWFEFIMEPLRLSKILKVTQDSVWPNVFLTVAELGGITPARMVNVLGGNFIFFGGILGFIYIFLFDGGSRNARYGFGMWCLALWTIILFSPALEASRFVLLLVVPVGLMFGLSVSKFFQLCQEGIKTYIAPVYRRVISAGVYLVLSFVVFAYLFNFGAGYMNLLPQMDRYWHNALIKIKKETPADAIINSWWDFGHWFKTVGDRRVLFDGMTQNTPYAYWTARILLTDKEEEALGILRLINTSGNEAADFLVKKEGMSVLAAVDLIQKSCVLPEAEARRFLKGKIAPDSEEVFLAYLFPKKMPPVYLIISYDMVGKIGPISYIGNWDFRKVDLWFHKRRLSKSEFIDYGVRQYRLTREDAEQKFLESSSINAKEAKQWFSSVWPQPSPVSPVFEKDGQLSFFENSAVVNEESHRVIVASEFKDRRGIPKNLFFMENELFRQEPQKDAGLPFSILMMKNGDKKESLFIDDVLAKSMLARLYFLRGEGLKFFKLWHTEADKQGNAIYIYQLQWPAA